jgi:hypothetical protein
VQLQSNSSIPLSLNNHNGSPPSSSLTTHRLLTAAMFNFTPLLGAQSASPASQSLLEFDGGIKVLIDAGWDESFDVEKLREIEKYVVNPPRSISELHILPTHRQCNQRKRTTRRWSNFNHGHLLMTILTDMSLHYLSSCSPMRQLRTSVLSPTAANISLCSRAYPSTRPHL